MCVSRYSKHPRTCRNSQMNPSSDTRDFGIFWPTVGDTRDTHTKPKTLSTHIHDTEFAHSHAPVDGRTSILAEETHKNFKNEKRDTLCARREVGGVQRWRGRPEAVARWLGGPTPPPLQSTPPRNSAPPSREALILWEMNQWVIISDYNAKKNKT